MFQTFRQFAANKLRVASQVVKYGSIMYCTNEYLAGLVQCSGPSMEPNINSGDILIVERISKRMQKLQRGDIVIVRSPSDPRSHLCKRIIGVYGDRVRSGFSYTIISKGQLWLEGDNSNNSNDSRSFGSVPEALVRGRAVCRIWPLDSVQMLTPDNN